MSLTGFKKGHPLLPTLHAFPLLLDFLCSLLAPKLFTHALERSASFNWSLDVRLARIFSIVGIQYGSQGGLLRITFGIKCSDESA